MGIAIFTKNSLNLPKQDDGFDLKWSNQTFDTMFECQKNCENLKLKVFRDFTVLSNVQQRKWSITDILEDVHSKYLRNR